jgi:hypothetical protein
MTDLLDFMPKWLWLILVGVTALLFAWKASGRPMRVTVFLVIGILSVGVGIALLFR